MMLRSACLALLALALCPAPGARAAEDVILSEFMAGNTRSVPGEANTFPDWIELRNRDSHAVHLEGWGLTVDPRRQQVWRFPGVTMEPGAHLLVWASGRDLRDPKGDLHTNFRLALSGDALALLRPDGSAATAFLPKYPPQSPDVSFGFLPGITQAVFFASPTPGAPNETSKKPPGPALLSLFHSPSRPRAGESLTITARAAELLAPVKAVTLVWRAGFHREASVPMQAAEPGVWTATIPGSAVEAGSCVRWRVTAEDHKGNASQLPLFGNPNVASRYQGVAVPGTGVTSALPVLELFLPPQQLGRADSEQGGRGCLAYDGEFYDNVFVKVRGNTTAGFPKKSHRLEFPHDHPFRHPGPGGRIRHTSLMAEFGDPTYLRQHLSFWLQEQAGSAAPFHHPVRVQLNGEFWQLAMHSEVLGEEFLERHHLDPAGALYKAVGTLTPDGMSTGGFEKKTRRQEGMRDYEQLAEALSRDDVKERRDALFRLMNLPAVVSYLAGARISQEDDDIWANMSLYHDNDGTGEWRPVAFDMNVSWGFSFASDKIQARNDGFRSHPFWGASRVGNSQGVNRLYDAVVAVPETREMLLRRMRTLMDRVLQPPGTPPAERRIESHIATLTQLMAPEAVLDREKWGGAWMTPQGATPETMLSLGVRDLIQRFVEPRRKHLYVTHSVTNTAKPIGITSADNAGIPEAQPSRVMLAFGETLAPADARSPVALTLLNTNSFAVDITGWRLTGKAKFSFEPGTVIPAGGRLRVCGDVKAWRSDAARAREFAVGPLRLNPGERGRVNLKDDADRTVATTDGPGLRP